MEIQILDKQGNGSRYINIPTDVAKSIETILQTLKRDTYYYPAIAEIIIEDKQRANLSVEEKLNAYYQEMVDEDDYDTVEDVRESLKSDWGSDRGYGIFDDDHYTPNGEILQCINRIDEMNIYDGDDEAAKQAEADGFVKLIHDIEFPKHWKFDELNIIKGTIIDNEHNRETLNKIIKGE